MTTAPQITRETDRYGRPLPADPEATRVKTNPVGVHVIPMELNKYARADLAAGAGVSWFERGRWTSEHVLHVRLSGGDRWFIGYQDDGAIVNHGEGMPRTQGRSLYAFADSSAIAAHPEMGTAADIRRWKGAGQWHEARMGDLVILVCRDEDGDHVETVAARIVPDGFRGSHLTLRLVERDA